MNTNQTPAKTETSDDNAWIAPDQRVELCSSSLLLTCCESNTNGNISSSTMLTPKSFFPIHEQSGGTTVAICRPHDNKTFSLFCYRPLSPGQIPSLAIRGRILYKLGRVTLKGDTSGTFKLWNNRTVVFRKQSDGKVAPLQRLDGLLTSPVPDKQQEAIIDRVLLLCAEQLLDWNRRELTPAAA